ncbi:SLAC1 anion channel family protein [Pseudomonas auratipiscis]|uniref:SLAC1 anion channel family protein n=1 Tax=Pseudomonas auratipiscis TaxID=3115853 RepID=A0AB35WKX7_9PSED|nr:MULTISPECIES: SLAC1 anion channel family protein [unclassified Pseudomonas]MEE1864956.1 SLAC1 anion channel family protein [Pseudomonas sp. 120P]MEE1956103.1 SLAC1 anion channel family protein [Pseudomonas sp. 119P]
MTQNIETAAAFGTPTQAVHEGRLAYLPVALFGSVMGLTGLSSAWHLASQMYGLPLWVSQLIGLFALLAFVLVSVGYAVKAITAPHAVKAEYLHPIAGNLFGTVFISLLLLPIPLAAYSPLLARVLWVIGATGMIIFAWLIVSRWLSQRQQAAHATPAWIVPVVGLLDIPLAMPTLQWDGVADVGMFALAVGLFFAIPLFTLIFSRLLFEEPIGAGLRPSLLILLAPFAVGFSAYVSLTGEVDRFASALYMLTLFFLAILLGRLRYLAKSCPFRLSWWSVGFPLAAATSCALRYAGHAPGVFTNGVAILLLAGTTLVIFGMAVRTLLGVAQGKLQALAG